MMRFKQSEVYEKVSDMFFVVFSDAWGRRKKVAVVERLKKESMYELSVVVIINKK